MPTPFRPNILEEDVDLLNVNVRLNTPEAVLAIERLINRGVPIHEDLKCMYGDHDITKDPLVVSVMKYGNVRMLELLAERGLNLDYKAGSCNNLLQLAVCYGDYEKTQFILDLALKQNKLERLINSTTDEGETPLDLATADFGFKSLLRHGVWDYSEAENLAAVISDIDALTTEEFNKEMVLYFLEGSLGDIAEYLAEDHDAFIKHMLNFRRKQLLATIAHIKDDSKNQTLFASKKVMISFINRDKKALDEEFKRLMTLAYKGLLADDYFKDSEFTCHYKGDRALVAKLLEYGANPIIRGKKGFSTNEKLSDAQRFFIKNMGYDGRRPPDGIQLNKHDDTLTEQQARFMTHFKDGQGADVCTMWIEYDHTEMQAFVKQESQEFVARSGTTEQGVLLKSLAARIQHQELKQDMETSKLHAHIRRHSGDLQLNRARLARHSLDLQRTGILVDNMAQLDTNRIPLILRDKINNDFKSHPELEQFFSIISGNIDKIIIGAKCVNSDIVVQNTTRNLQQKVGALTSAIVNSLPFPGTHVAAMVLGWAIQGRSVSHDSWRYGQIVDVCSKLESDLLLAKNISLIALHQYQPEILNRELSDVQVKALANVLTAVCIGELVGHRDKDTPSPQTIYDRIGAKLDAIKPELLSLIQTEIKSKSSIMNSAKNFFKEKSIESKMSKR